MKMFLLTVLLSSSAFAMGQKAPLLDEAGC